MQKILTYVSVLSYFLDNLPVFRNDLYTDIFTAFFEWSNSTVGFCLAPLTCTSK